MDNRLNRVLTLFEVESDNLLNNKTVFICTHITNAMLHTRKITAARYAGELQKVGLKALGTQQLVRLTA